MQSSARDGEDQARVNSRISTRLPKALGALRAHGQFIVVKVVPSASRPGKTDKLPIDWRTGAVADAHDPAIWMQADQAEAVLAGWPGHHLGFVLTANDPLWCLDVDGCLGPDGWSTTVQRLFALLPGAAVELSVSRAGVHFWGTGPVPEHRKKCVPLGLELYTEARFICLTGEVLQGDASARCDQGLAQLVATCFPPDVAAHDAPDEGPVPEWRGPTDDDELIRRAMASRSAAAAFGRGASFADLWTANEQVLAVAYPSSSDDAFDRSSADAALCQHLAFWTGRDRARVARLLKRSGLARDKHQREDYLSATVGGACGRQTNVLQDRTPAATGAHAANDEGAYCQLFHDAPVLSARLLLQHEYSQDRLKHWAGNFYRWDRSAWTEQSADDVRARIYGFLERNASEFQPNQQRVSNIQDALKACAHVPSSSRPPCWLEGESIAAPEDLAVCANGLLDVRVGGELHLPTPRYFNLSALSAEFRPNAPAPVEWLAFLASVWPDDPDSVATLQEVFGYLLTPDTRQQKMFMIIGPRRSGKGTISRVLAELLGPSNVAGPTLSSLGTPFGLAPLVGKQLAIVSDARLGGKADPKVTAENLLRISGEDSVEVDRKFLPPMTLRLTARFLIMSNELPKFGDASGALASRFVLLTMRQSFLGREDLGLTARLLRELPGILLWALEGLRRLRSRGHFVAPKSSAEMADEFGELTSPIATFVAERCELDPAAESAPEALFTEWQDWCVKSGHRSSSLQVFGRDLRAAFPELETVRPHVGGRRERRYRGIRSIGPRWSAVQHIAGNSE